MAHRRAILVWLVWVLLRPKLGLEESRLATESLGLGRRQPACLVDVDSPEVTSRSVLL
jgi:hypothetical protein